MSTARAVERGRSGVGVAGPRAAPLRRRASREAAIARHALYLAPPAGSALDVAGAALLGRCARSRAALPHPPALIALAADLGLDWAALTAGPRRYGLHATLKAPFALAPRRDAAGLREAARDLAAAHPPFEAALRVAAVGRFLALVPAARSAPLHALADAAVRDLDPWRAPLTPEDRARRRPDKLSEHARDNLDRWGYPHVLEDYRPHVTLTGPLDDGSRAALAAALAAHLAPALAAPWRVGAVALFEEPAPGAPFRLLEELPLLRGAT